MKNNMIVYEAEFKEVAPKLQVAVVDAENIGDHIFAQIDWEIDSIMREIGAR